MASRFLTRKSTAARLPTSHIAIRIKLHAFYFESSCRGAVHLHCPTNCTRHRLRFLLTRPPAMNRNVLLRPRPCSRRVPSLCLNAFAGSVS